MITVKAYGVSRRVRKILEGTTSKNTSGMLDLGKEEDIADFLLRKRGEPGPDAGYESAASSGAESVAGDDGDAIDLADDYVGRNNKKGQRRAVRLDEIGPRLELRLVKITEGVPGKEGGVMYHEFVKKSKKEIAEQKAAHATKEKLRKERREEQERNVARKKAEKEKKEKKSVRIAGDKDEEDKSAEEEDEDMEEDGEQDEDAWDDEEEITDGEESDAEDDGSDIGDEGEESSDDEEERRRPRKKLKAKGK